MKTAHRGEEINVMTQALCIEDGSLPQGLVVQNGYMELHSGNKNVTLVVRNSTIYPKTLRKKTPVARAAMLTWILEVPVQIRSMEASEKEYGHQMPRITVKQQQEKLFKELDLSRLESWPQELVEAAWPLLAEYHNVFSLESSELGCSHSTKHVIKGTNDIPLKEQFRQIPLPLVEEVHMHL